MIPIVAYVHTVLSPSQRRRAEALAHDLRREREEVLLPSKYEPLVPESLDDRPSLHVDDQSALASPSGDASSSYVQDRARVRAVDGDYVVTTTAVDPAFEPYCEERLGLGRVQWLVATAEGDSRRLANHTMRDRAVRSELVRAFRRDELFYVHPYMGHTDVWELALSLHRASRRPVKVVAPPPAVTALVNDKVRFSEIATRLFGPRLLPETMEASSLAFLSERARELARRHETLVVKLPDSAAGSGNVVLDASEYRDVPLQEISEKLKPLLDSISWAGEKHLLVGAWTEGVLQAPSVQLWVPPAATGDPIVEGLFEQNIEAGTLRFLGSRRAALPKALAQEIAERSALLALVFQNLGYVGRCSFDLVLTGPALESCRIELIEANGRWGGTSTPMTLVTRLLGKWWQRDYVESALALPNAGSRSFGDVLTAYAASLFDIRTSEGRLVLYNPASIRERGVVHTVAFSTEGAVQSPGGSQDDSLTSAISRG